MKLIALLLIVASLGGCASTPSVLNYAGTSSMLNIQAYDSRKNVDRDVAVVVYSPSVPAQAKPAVILLSGCNASFGSAAGELVKQLTAAGALWAAAGFKDTLLRWKLKPEVGYGNETAIQPGVQARGREADWTWT